MDAKHQPRDVRSELENEIENARMAINDAERALHGLERQVESLDLEPGDPDPVIVAARRLWPDFDYRATNRFIPEDALIEAIRDLERKS